MPAGRSSPLVALCAAYWLVMRVEGRRVNDNPTFSLIEDLGQSNNSEIQGQGEHRASCPLPADFEGKSHYEILGVPESASDSDISEAFRALEELCSPEADATEGAAGRFERLKEAQVVLTDPAQRRQYGKSCPAHAVKSRSDPDGDCSCSEAQSCHDEGSLGCPYSAGLDAKLFRYDCETCECQDPVTCPASASHTAPDMDGDCECPEGTACYNGTTRGCGWTGAEEQLTYFPYTCANCECKEPTRTDLKCPEGTKSDSPDGDGDCSCQPGFRCQRRKGGPCRYSAGSSRQYFNAECQDCKCVALSDNSTANPRCPAMAGYMPPDELGECSCVRGVCYESGVQGCRTEDGRSDKKFKLGCARCTCRSGRPPGRRRRCPVFAQEDYEEDGDCRCPPRMSCYQQGKRGCTSRSGHDTASYFDVACKDCICSMETHSPTPFRDRIFNSHIVLIFGVALVGSLVAWCLIFRRGAQGRGLRRP